jgi:antitoxin (DNA-binding transcriptional repressor) of toxin-antitoxin stability system
VKALDFSGHVGQLYNMKKPITVTSRDFQHRFSSMADSLKPGESITVTKHGQPIGTFTKASKPRPAPDYLGNLQKLGHSLQDGQKVIDAICDLS